MASKDGVEPKPAVAPEIERQVARILDKVMEPVGEIIGDFLTANMEWAARYQDLMTEQEKLKMAAADAIAVRDQALKEIATAKDSAQRQGEMILKLRHHNTELTMETERAKRDRDADAKEAKFAIEASMRQAEQIGELETRQAAQDSQRAILEDEVERLEQENKELAGAQSGLSSLVEIMISLVALVIRDRAKIANVEKVLRVLQAPVKQGDVGRIETFFSAVLEVSSPEANALAVRGISALHEAMRPRHDLAHTSIGTSNGNKKGGNGSN